MAAAIFLLLFFSTFSTVTAQQRNSNISLGSSLSPTNSPNSWLSRSGRFAFGFYQQGDSFAIGIWFAGIPDKTVVWTANRDDPLVTSNDTLFLTSDGRLILRPTQGQNKSISNAPEPASSASMLDSGNFVLYNSDSEIIWQSFESPTNTILQGQRLLAGQQLFSSASKTDDSKGRFRLKMQRDGHLLLFPVDGPDETPYVYWGSNTADTGDNVTLNLDGDGHLYLLNSTSFNIKNLTDGGFRANGTIFYRTTIDVDGIFRLYSHSLDQKDNWSIKWESSKNKCDPMGQCGLNAYCTLTDIEYDCNCLPGFDFIEQSQRTLGCVRNSNVEDCKEEYPMYTLKNTVFEDNPYYILSSTTEGDCEEACLRDCRCEAARYKDQECRKQKLPLRYGKRDQSDSTMIFVKMGVKSPVSTNNTPKTTKKVAKEIKKVRKDILMVSAAFVICAIIVLAISSVLIYRHRIWAYNKISNQRDSGLDDEISLSSFTYGELVKATDGFKEEVGRGASGVVFKGTLSNSQRVVAIKRLEGVVTKGEGEFLTEMRVIGRTHHRNLVRLLGYCHEGSHRLLVYEYMSNGSLADFLFSPERCPSWDERVKIALNIARGILYLHEECDNQIIHCDIKPQNILMGDYQCAKIADFGLSKLLKPDQTRTFTGIRGTKGYVAPEWHRNLPITVKADVYSFGIVLLEIISCRRNFDMELPDDEVVLADWVCDCFQFGELGKLVSDEDVDKKRLERMVRVALWCIQDDPSLRPSMKKVVLMLEGTIDIPVPPSPTSFLSEI